MPAGRRRRLNNPQIPAEEFRPEFKICINGPDQSESGPHPLAAVSTQGERSFVLAVFLLMLVSPLAKCELFSTNNGKI